MKTIVLAILGCSVITLLWGVLFAGGSETRPGDRSSPATKPSSGDAGSELVAAFYKALLQDNPPTLEQEKALLTPSEGLRSRLVEGGFGTEKDPVILLFLRKHKELFLPKQVRADYVQISSTFNWVRDVDQMKEAPKPGYGYVLATFREDREAKPGSEKDRLIVFAIEDGRIDPAAIKLEFEHHKTMLEEFLKVWTKADAEFWLSGSQPAASQPAKR